MFATTRAFLDHFDLQSLDELPPLAALRELERQLPVEDLDPEVPADLQARADLALAEDEEDVAEPRSETNFRTLLAELDAMEQGLKSDFDDLPLALELADAVDEPSAADVVESAGRPE